MARPDLFQLIFSLFMRIFCIVFVEQEVSGLHLGWISIFDSLSNRVGRYSYVYEGSGKTRIKKPMSRLHSMYTYLPLATDSLSQAWASTGSKI